eukprot:g10025.t1
MRFILWGAAALRRGLSAGEGALLQIAGRNGHQEFVPPPGGKVLQDTTTTANMPSAGPVVVVLLVALLAAGFYSYFAKMKTPRNFAQPEQELSGDHFTAMPEATLRRRDHSCDSYTERLLSSCVIRPFKEPGGSWSGGR